MCKLYKYDIAFSFAEEDRSVAKQIAAELKKKKIHYYLYTEHEAKQWGLHIFNITLETYRKSRFVLMITSEEFINGYWADIERMAVLSQINKMAGRILQLKLDSAVVDGLSRNIVYKEWNNNPADVAQLLFKKVRIAKAREAKIKRIIFPISLALCLALISIFFLVYLPAICPGTYPKRFVKPIMITGMHSVSSSPDHVLGVPLTSDTFYISETEVTVKEYRKYCDSTKELFPPQPSPVLNNNPVVNITWEEAQAFCKWIGARLPSEEEWEHAASSGLNTKYSGGDNALYVAVYNRKHFKPVATKCSNGFGLFDMSGNVAEWCQNAFDSTDRWKVVKGGSHNDKIAELLIAHRGKELFDVRKPYIGFRVAWDNKPSN